MCGGRCRRCVSLNSGAGSSPRVRGTPSISVLSFCLTRIIPACAGDAIQRASSEEIVRDHPRVCGGRRCVRQIGERGHGSSPRVRGTRVAEILPLDLARIIPACAGDATVIDPARAVPADHPRVCGGRVRVASLAGRQAGSSPRVRGTRWALYWRSMGAPDHPRVCGGRCLARYGEKRFVGSSPRVRGTRPPASSFPRSSRIIPAGAGTLLPAPGFRTSARIIPACAGDASAQSMNLVSISDHPRVCGGRSPSYTFMMVWESSSPRVRGTLKNVKTRECRTRIIPACAGDAGLEPRLALRGPDQPRVCGGRAAFSRSGLALIGSSPRVRGTHALLLAPFGKGRIIPACAGDAGIT